MGEWMDGGYLLVGIREGRSSVGQCTATPGQRLYFLSLGILCLEGLRITIIVVYGINGR